MKTSSQVAIDHRVERIDLATLAFLPLFPRWHVHEEAPLFARDINRRIAGGAL